MKEVTRKSRLEVCRICRKKRFRISRHGLCQHCATERVALARLEIKHKQGKIYEKWRKNTLRGFGVDINRMLE